MSRRLLPLLVSIVTGAWLAGCHGNPAEPAGAQDPDVIGTIIAVFPGEPLTTLRVGSLEVPAPAQSGLRELALNVSDETEVFVPQPDGSLVRADASALTAGAKITAWHTGVELRSDPPQYIATKVIVLSSSSGISRARAAAEQPVPLSGGVLGP